MQNGKEPFAYVYLKNSFATLHISQIAGMAAWIDMVAFSIIWQEQCNSTRPQVRRSHPERRALFIYTCML